MQVTSLIVSSEYVYRVVKARIYRREESPFVDHGRFIQKNVVSTEELISLAVVILVVLSTNDETSVVFREVDYRREEEEVGSDPNFWPNLPVFNLRVEFVNLLCVPAEPVRLNLRALYLAL